MIDNVGPEGLTRTSVLHRKDRYCSAEFEQGMTVSLLPGNTVWQPASSYFSSANNTGGSLLLAAAGGRVVTCL